MSKAGEKRQAEVQIGPEDNETTSDRSTPTTPTSGMGFVFRPSSLSQVASSLSTYSRQPSLGRDKIVDSKLSLSFTKPQLMSPHSPKPLTGLINGISPPGLKRKLDDPSSTDVTTPTKRSNLFMQCIEQQKSPSQTTSKEGEGEGEGGSGFVFGQELASRVTKSNTSIREATPPAQANETSHVTKSAPDEEVFTSATSKESTLTFSGQQTPVLPEVEKVTGEEGERHIVQIACKLFAFDSSTHNWREKGRGELRLNDSPQSEGVFQSRIIIRASGSYRVLLNTNVWCNMSCDRASPQSVRITAQEANGKFGIFLIKGLVKDIHHLFSSLDQRLKALRRNKPDSSPSSTSHTPSLPPSLQKEVTTSSFDEEDSIVGDRASSVRSTPDSSPERHPQRLASSRVTTETSTTTPTFTDANSDFSKAPPTLNLCDSTTDDKSNETTPTNS